MIALALEKPVSAPGIGPSPTIRTPRLLLRPHVLEDADAMAVSLADFSVSRIPAPYHRQDAIDWLVQQSASKISGWNLAVCDTDGRHLGMVALEMRHGLWHLGYWMNRSVWGRGLMTEAASKILEAFFERLPEATVHSGVFSDNPGSLRVQQKLGFAITGCRDVFSTARNCMVMHIDTSMTARDLQIGIRR